jgi:hypothetical protein
MVRGRDSPRNVIRCSRIMSKTFHFLPHPTEPFSIQASNIVKIVHTEFSERLYTTILSYSSKPYFA